MTDQLEELLLRQEQQGDEPLWWKDRPVHAVSVGGWIQQTGAQSAAKESGLTAQAGQTGVQGRAPTETAGQESAGAQTARELERARRAARRAVQVSAGREMTRRSSSGSEQAAGYRAAVALKNSPAAGRQGLTAQIDTQFRRDARRYDGRLGLL